MGERIQEEQKKKDPRSKEQKDWDVKFQNISNKNSEIILRIDNSIDPMDTSKTKQFQHFMNLHVHGDNVLEEDGSWGIKTQESFDKYKRMKRYAHSWNSPTDLSIGPLEYEINTSSRDAYGKKVALDSLYQTLK